MTQAESGLVLESFTILTLPSDTGPGCPPRTGVFFIFKSDAKPAGIVRPPRIRYDDVIGWISGHGRASTELAEV